MDPRRLPGGGPSHGTPAQTPIRPLRAPHPPPAPPPAPTGGDTDPTPRTAVPRTLPSGASLVVKREQPQHPPGAHEERKPRSFIASARDSALLSSAQRKR